MLKTNKDSLLWQILKIQNVVLQSYMSIKTSSKKRVKQIMEKTLYTEIMN